MPGKIVSQADDVIRKDLYRLLSGESITSYIDTTVVYPRIQSDPYSIYSFLSAAGYLKITKKFKHTDGNYMCEVSIPNKEIF